MLRLEKMARQLCLSKYASSGKRSLKYSLRLAKGTICYRIVSVLETR